MGGFYSPYFTDVKTEGSITSPLKEEMGTETTVSKALSTDQILRSEHLRSQQGVPSMLP